MARRRFRYSTAEGKLVELSYEGEMVQVQIMGDSHYDGLRATDGTDISTRTKHREYMKRNDLAMADDFKETWKKAAEDRAKYFQGQTGTVTKEDIGFAIHQLESKSSKRKS